MAVSAGIVTLLLEGACHAQGTFEGRVAVEWLTGATPERDMRLLEDFAYIDPKGKRWSVPKGSIVNGASIPRALWTMAGSPYTGNYRRASVVHDHYCVTRTERWRDVHRMFFHAMIAGGVSDTQAKLFYSAVYGGGPRWKSVTTKNFDGQMTTMIVPERANVPPEVMDETASWIMDANPTLEEIERKLDAGSSPP